MVEGNPERTAEEDVRLVRVRDLSSLRPDSLMLVATPAMARMTAEGARRAARHTRLQSGDILLTVTGTVGKVAVVGEGGPKLIAASGVDVIRVRDAALASYLPRLLTTEPYQDWLWRRSHGSTVSRLRVDDVEHIPVPRFTGGVAPEAIRHVSVGQSLDGIIRLLESKPRFSASVRFLLEDSLVRNLGDEPIEGHVFSLTPKGLRSLLPRLDEVLRDGTIDEGIEPLHDWLRGIHDFATRLVDVLDLPIGPERFSSLQAWKLALDAEAGDFQKAREELRSRAQSSRKSSDSQRVVATVQERSEALLEALIEVWRSDCDDHLNNARLSATLSPALVTLGIPTEISVSVVNEGALPLRKLVFETRPAESQAACNLLRAGASFQWPVKVVGRESGKQTILLRWTGRRMDESEASGDIELAFEVVSLRVAAQVTRLEKSPYVVGSPLDPKSKVFFGRDDLIAQINRTLRTEGPSTVILLEGNRRVGKSSLLKRLANGAMPADWIPIYVNFQSFDGTAGKPGMATQEIFYGIAKELIIAASRAVPTYRVPEVEQAVPAQEGMQQTAFFIKQVRPLFQTESSFEVFRLIVESVLAAVEPRRLLLMLDEFDKIQEGIDTGITSPQLPENLRNLFHSYERVSGILTGSRTIRRLREEYWSVLFGLGISIPIKGLDDAAARKLVTDPVKGQLVYAPGAVDFVVERCARQPFLIQGLCHSIFELCAVTEERTVTVETAAKAADRYAMDNEHFRSIWDHIGNHRRQYLVCLVDELASQGTPVTLEFLRLTLEQRGIAYRAIKALTEDLDELVAFEILGVEGDQRQRRYRIEIPIFSEWLRNPRNVDSAAHRLEAINAMR
jgi:type I restriction enzyme M protein